MTTYEKWQQFSSDPTKAGSFEEFICNELDERLDDTELTPAELDDLEKYLTAQGIEPEPIHTGIHLPPGANNQVVESDPVPLTDPNAGSSSNT